MSGEVAERTNAHDSKSCNGFTPVRGFESHPLRHKISNGHAVLSRDCSEVADCRRGDRAAEGARLESALSRKGHVGSNPTLSATQLSQPTRGISTLTPNAPTVQ